MLEKQPQDNELQEIYYWLKWQRIHKTNAYSWWTYLHTTLWRILYALLSYQELSICISIIYTPKPKEVQAKTIKGHIMLNVPPPSLVSTPPSLSTHAPCYQNTEITSFSKHFSNFKTIVPNNRLHKALKAFKRPKIDPIPLETQIWTHSMDSWYDTTHRKKRIKGWNDKDMFINGKFFMHWWK